MSVVIGAAIAIACFEFSVANRLALGRSNGRPVPLRSLYNESDLIVVATRGISRIIKASDGSLRLRTALQSNQPSAFC